MGVSAA